MDRRATDEMTRALDLDRLVGDSGFLRYHAEYAKRRRSTPSMYCATPSTRFATAT